MTSFWIFQGKVATVYR